jgi:amino acid adenylation domain-containing protein/non-ribosomal peptide synthase protein (TIGR01720 family)
MAEAMENILDGYRLSPQQKRLWLLQQDEATYQSRGCVLFEGTLCVATLQRALAQVLGRHEILRTVFRRRAGIRIPVQFALDAPSLAWREYDLRGDEMPGQKSRLEEIVSREDATPFDFASGPVCRATLLRLDDQRYILRLCLPALCADASTLANIVHELTDAYAGAENAGGVDAGSDEAVQYVQFAEWHNELLESGEDEDGTAFWSGWDAAALSSLKLGFERTPEAGTPFAPECMCLTFEAATVATLDASAAAAGATPELFLLACWQTLLWRLTGREEIIVGRESDGRKFEELAAACGLFARWLPVRASFAPGQTFAEVLRHTDEAVRESEAWQEYFNPETLASPVANDASPFFSYGFSYEALPAPVQLPGLAVSLLARHTFFEPFRMKLTCVRAGDALSAQLYYDPSAFTAGDASRVAHAFETLLASLALDPSAPVCAAEILGAREKRRLLVELNQTVADFPSDQCLHQLFEAQAAATPDAPAVAFDGRTLTYAELNSRANRLAHYLRRRGVGRDTLVALCVERSLEMIVGLVGIMKAGGAYVPLDPEQPASRLAYQLEDSRSPVLVTQRALCARLPEFAGEVICLDEEAAPFASEDERDPSAVCVPSDCAYVIYTSGSTGIPKGVAVTHRGAVNYTAFIMRKLGLDAGARRPLHFATVSTISADLGNTAIFPALASGGCLHVIPYATATDGARFAKYVSTNGIDVLKIVPSHLGALLAAAKDAHILPRQFLIMGGEALSFELLERIRKSPAGCRVINHYGPTETTIGSLICTPDDERTDRAVSATVPIGRPIANTEAFILDQNLQPVPVGVAGELLIGGAGLARGYVNKPEQTAEKFIKHPFSDEAGARLYRTGDLARFLPDGQIEFLGRVDHQVKIRGFRVEPGEVEARLKEHTQVRESVVVAREDERGHKRLVAYIVARQGTSFAVAELRGFLQQSMPDYMIPSAFVLLKALPLTANGKVDRAQLPDPATATADAQQIYLAPRTAAETKLAEIWQQVLGLPRVGVNDNFFELGGDSILSLQIIAKANGEGLRLTPKQLFDSPTVAALAAAVIDNAPAICAEQGEVTGEVPLTPIQRWFFEHDFADLHHWNMSLVLEARRAVDPTLLERALHSLLRHHDALRLRFTRTEQGRSQSSAPHTNAPLLEVVSLAKLSVEAQATAFEREATRIQSTIDLTSGRLLRAAWFDYGADEPGLLLLAAHHLCVDGISWRIIAEDLQRAYEDLEAGREAHLPAKTTSWQEWAGQLSERATSREVKSEASEWLDARRLDAAPLPTDFAEASEHNTVADARTISLALRVEETEALLRDVPAAYQTQINDVLLAALADALHKWTSNPVSLIDVEGHGREHSDERLDVSRTVGWFTTHYPVALDVSRAFNGESLLKGVREQLARVPHNGIGYGLLRYLGGDSETARRLSAEPQPEVSFNYLGQIAQANADGALFALSRESGGAQRSPASARTHLLQVIAKVLDGRFELSVSYGARTHRRETVEKFAADFTASLRGLIAGSRSESSNGLAASDFPESGLTAKELERVLAQLANEESAQLDGGAENIEDLYVLSPMQEGLLFHSLSEPGEDAYFRQVSLRMRGRVRVSLFEEAWRRVVERHTSLRTSFMPERQLQIVRRRVELPLEKHDWRDVPEAEREGRFASLLRAEEERGLNVERAPLMRLVLVQFAEDDYRLVWSYHHLVLEAWSRALIYKEVLAVYQALAEEREPGFERAPSYREYIAWLRQQDLTEAETFWRGALAGFNEPSPLTLDAEPPESTEDSRLSNISEWTLPADTTATLHALARRQHLTLNTLVQGAWAILLSRYTGDEDIVFGMVVAGRPVEVAAVESIVGLFINTLPVRVSVSADESLLPWLAALQAWQGEARQYEYSPLVRVQGWSELPRGATLFETVVNFGNFPSAADASNAVAGVEFCDARFVERGSYPLGLEVSPGTHMLLRAVYDARRFSPASVEAMLRRLGDVLQWFAANPETSLGEITLRQEPLAALESSSDIHDAEAEFAF